MLIHLREHRSESRVKVQAYTGGEGFHDMKVLVQLATNVLGFTDPATINSIFMI